LQPSRVHAVSAAVLDLLSELELRLTQDANVLQQEFSTVSLGSDSALHISSSAELEVSAQTFSNASPDSPAPRDKYRSTKCADNHSDGSFIGAMEDTYISDRNGYDEDDGGLPEHSHPQPPTPPNDDDILELESLILSLNSSPVSRPPVDVSVSETKSIALSSHEVLGNCRSSQQQPPIKELLPCNRLTMLKLRLQVPTALLPRKNF
jgi:hypothetical protein